MDCLAIEVVVGLLPGGWSGGWSWAARKMPWVASLACWRKTVLDWEEAVVDATVRGWWGPGGSGSWRTSIGMLSLWQANMEFIIGMYWWARSVDGDSVMMRMRDCRELLVLLVGSVAVAADCSAKVAEMPVVDSWYCWARRLMKLNANVSAPAIIVLVFCWIVSGEVVDIKLLRFLMNSSSISRKGRYFLLSDSVMLGEAPLVASGRPFSLALLLRLVGPSSSSSSPCWPVFGLPCFPIPVSCKAAVG